MCSATATVASGLFADRRISSTESTASSSPEIPRKTMMNQTKNCRLR